MTEPRRCALDGCNNPAPGAAMYCSQPCRNEGRRQWHAANPGGNRARYRRPLKSAYPSLERLRQKHRETAVSAPAPIVEAPPIAPPRGITGAEVADIVCRLIAPLEHQIAALTETVGRQQAEIQRLRQPPVRTVTAARPPAPAPVKRGADGGPLVFQDDGRALADHGSAGATPEFTITSAGLTRCAGSGLRRLPAPPQSMAARRAATP